jgi:hypothetical protein
MEYLTPWSGKSQTLTYKSTSGTRYIQPSRYQSLTTISRPIYNSSSMPNPTYNQPMLSMHSSMPNPTYNQPILPMHSSMPPFQSPMTSLYAPRPPPYSSLPPPPPYPSTNSYRCSCCSDYICPHHFKLYELSSTFCCHMCYVRYTFSSTSQWRNRHYRS